MTPFAVTGSDIRAGAIPIDVVHVAAEYWPLAQTGGLAEAVAGLAKAQAALPGVTVTAIIPYHRSVALSGAAVEPVGIPFPVPVGRHRIQAQLYRVGGSPGPRLFVVGNEMFDRPGPYGEGGVDYEDNALRYTFFCRAALEALPYLTRHPVVLHAHDWHTALAPVLLRTLYRGTDYYDRVATVFAVHNASFQGAFPPRVGADLGLLELPGSEYLEWYGRVNLLKGGVEFSDAVTTVSPSHARELCTAEGGFGLHDVFSRRGERFAGILNGYDVDRWDPVTDRLIPRNYSAADLSGKRQCKTDLQRHFALRTEARVPLVALSARLVAQKGLDLIVDGLLRDMDPVQFVVLGRGDPYFEARLQRIATEAPERIAVPLEFSDPLEHRLLAGADMLLMPSIFEPCGLTQLRGLRYGALPVARSVGGLADSIENDVTGFLFSDPTTAALRGVLERAVARYGEPDRWTGYVQTAMQRDFSWDRSAARYQALYRQVLAERWG